MLLGAAAACVMSFAVEDCKSYWSGCIQAAISDLSADFRTFGPINFPFKILLKKCFKIVCFLLWRRDPVLELLLPTPLRVCVLQFSLCRSHCNGCVKVAW